jgi:hypothetical protein
MKDTPTLAASPISQEALDSLLITAAGNPQGEARDENRLTQTVSGLLARGANVNAVTSDGFTALMLAAFYGHTEIVSALLSREGIDVNAADSDGHTALMSAVHNHHAETVSALLSCKGIDVNAADSDGRTVLMTAAFYGHTETVSALLSREGIDVNVARSGGFTALITAAFYGHAETISALLSRDGVDWQIVQDQLNHPVLRNLNKEVSVLLAFILPEGETRNSIITSFNQRNPNDAIQQENWAGPEMYKTLKDLKSWHIRYLTDSGRPENEVRNLANRRFFDLLNHQDARQEALARNDLVADLVGKSASLAADFERIAKGIEIEDQETLSAVRGLSPEDLYKLTARIIDKSKDGNGIPTLQASSLVAVLRKVEIDQTSPAPTINRNSAAKVAESISPLRQNGGCCVVS